MALLGLEVVTAINTGTMAAPAWDVIGQMKDETLNMSKNLVDVTTRAAAGWRLQQGALREATIDFQLLFDAADTDFQAFATDFFGSGTQVIVGLWDGDILTPGTYTGLHSAANVTNFTVNRALEDAVSIDVTLTLAQEAGTNTAPIWGPITIP